MDNRSLNSLLELLDEPILLRLHVANLRSRKDLDDAVLGFIELYDEFQGDCSKIKKQLNVNKSVILKPLQVKRLSNAKVNLLKYAAIFAFIGMSTFLTYHFVKQDEIILSSTFSDPGLPNYMGKSASVDLSEAMFHYRKGDFEKAYSAIESVKKAHPNNDTVQYYSALIAFENGERDHAVKQFESITKSRSAFADRAFYFIGVNASELNQLSKACKIFKTLAKCEDEFVRDAAKSHYQQLQRYLH
jgi:tetratricopeptide (TPR) repeat protein